VSLSSAAFSQEVSLKDECKLQGYIDGEWREVDSNVFPGAHLESLNSKGMKLALLLMGFGIKRIRNVCLPTMAKLFPVNRLQILLMILLRLPLSLGPPFCLGFNS